MAMDMSVAHAYGADGRRLITPEYPPITDWEMKNLDADRLHIYADSQYQYEQEMRVRWENFTQDNYRLHCEVQKLCQVAQQQFCLEDDMKKEEHAKVNILLFLFDFAYFILQFRYANYVNINSFFCLFRRKLSIKLSTNLLSTYL